MEHPQEKIDLNYLTTSAIHPTIKGASFLANFNKRGCELFLIIDSDVG